MRQFIHHNAPFMAIGFLADGLVELTIAVVVVIAIQLLTAPRESA